ncbi:hypothetical protein ACIPR8_07110 [Stenotrophomonas sp. LARHCG68]
MAAELPLWDYPVGGDIAWQFEWLTEVLAPGAGNQQNRRLRHAPRITISFEALVAGAQHRLLENMLSARGSQPWRVPLPAGGGVLTADVAAGSTGLTVAGVAPCFADGGDVLITDGARQEVCNVASVVGGTLALAAPVSGPWPAGSKAFPLYAGRLYTLPAVSRFTSSAASLRLEFALTGDLPIAMPAEANTYRDFPVLELPIDWGADPAWTPTRELVTRDIGTAAVFAYDQRGYALPELAFGYTAVGATEIGALLARLYTLAGRFGAVWVPTFGQDLRVVASSAGASVLDVEACGLAGNALPPSRRDIRIRLADGTLLYRRVLSVVSVGGAVERLALSESLPVFPLASVVECGWMLLAAQSADIVRLQWWKDDVAAVEFSFRGVAHGN